MKKSRNFISSLTTAALVTGLALTFNACTENSPLNVEANLPSSENELHFISLGQESPSLNKKGKKDKKGKKGKDAKVLVEVTEFVTYKDGGELIIDYKGDEHRGGDESVKTTFKVFSETISQDAGLVLSMTDALLSGEVDVSFQPHGITFSEPALLNIEAKNIDLSGVKTKNIGIFYVNEETGKWEEMQTYDIIVKKKEGYLKIIDAEIPHFSRYAVAWSR